MLLALLLATHVERAGGTRLVVIVAQASPLADISSADLRDIYLGRLTRSASRHAIVPLIPPQNSAAGDVFLRRFMRMAELDYAQLWIGVVFRGQASSAPLVARSPDEAARFVAAHVDAIAIVGDVPNVRNVRVLTVDGKPPDAPDYPLRW